MPDKRGQTELQEDSKQCIASTYAVAVHHQEVLLWVFDHYRLLVAPWTGSPSLVSLLTPVSPTFLLTRNL